MNADTAEWIKKAEGDYGSARLEMRETPEQNFDASCYHSQQAAEKYLKAWLQEQNADFPKIHELLRLMRRCAKIDPGFRTLRPFLKPIDDFALRYRYPGDDATLADAEMAYQSVTEVRNFVRSKLGI